MNYHKVISRPMKLRWAGWETNTVYLQQAGWEISAEQLFEIGSFRLAFTHKDFKIYGITEECRLNYFSYHNNSFEYDLPILNVQWIASELYITIRDDLRRFKPVDAYPQLTEEIKRIDQFDIFATPLARTEEIIVDPNDVADMLRRIKEIQKPIQKEIREKARKESLRYNNYETRPRQRFHAQILSVA